MVDKSVVGGEYTPADLARGGEHFALPCSEE